jgi:hypothetical protein
MDYMDYGLENLWDIWVVLCRVYGPCFLPQVRIHPDVIFKCTGVIVPGIVLVHKTLSLSIEEYTTGSLETYSN